MKYLLITGCSDPLMWYANLVGTVVPYCGIWPESGWASREKSGYSNMIKFEDAEMIVMTGGKSANLYCRE